MPVIPSADVMRIAKNPRLSIRGFMARPIVSDKPLLHSGLSEVAPGFDVVVIGAGAAAWPSFSYRCGLVSTSLITLLHFSGCDVLMSLS
jgi:hypothetical protein